MNTNAEIEGRGVLALPLRWRRGSAKIVADQIRLDGASAKEYEAGGDGLAGRGSLLSDLAAVGELDIDPYRDEVKRRAIRFVKDHGLLRGGPGSDRFSEPLRELWLDGWLVHLALSLHRDLRAYTAAPSQRGRERLAASYREVLRGHPAGDVHLTLSQQLASLVSQGLGRWAGYDDQTQFIAEPRSAPQAVRPATTLRLLFGPPPDFLLGIASADLLGLAWGQIAMHVTDVGTLSRCHYPRCGRLFLQRRRARLYCSSMCSQLMRDMRHDIAKKEAHDR